MSPPALFAVVFNRARTPTLRAFRLFIFWPLNIDLDKAIDPANDGTSKAVVNRLRVTPDIQVIAKGLGGGYQPIGGILVHGRVIEALSKGSGTFKHGHTYQAHPVACAAALAVQEVIRDEKLLDNTKAMGALLEQGLVERLGNHAHVGDIRGRGLFWAVELVKDRASKAVYDPALAMNECVKKEAFKRGLACYPMGGTIDGKHGHAPAPMRGTVTGENRP